MIKRPLCMACLVFLAIQVIRVGVLQCTEDQKPSALEQSLSEGTSLSLTGTIYKIEEKSKVTAVYLKDNAVQSKDQIISESKILVYIRPDQTEEQLKIGNLLQIRGEGEVFEPPSNPGCFDQRAYYQRQGIHVLVWAEKVLVCDGETDQVRESLARVRRAWCGLLREHLGEYYGNTMCAILLGEKSGLDSQMKKMYQKNGIGHLLAISGLHMSFLGTGIYSLLRKAGLPFSVSGTAGSIALILYTVMIGSGVSSMRALVMFLVKMGAEVTGRDYDLPTSLALSAALLCAGQPLYLTDAGFLLSFGAILGISLLGPVFTEMFWGNLPAVPLLKGALSGLGTSLAVNIFLLGPMLYFYFEIPPYGVLLNLLVIPLMPAVMGAGLLGSALAVVSDTLGGWILAVCGILLTFYDGVCAGAGNLPADRIVTGRPGWGWLSVYYLLIGLLYLLFCRRKANREKKEDEGIRGCSIRLPGGGLILCALAMILSCRLGNRWCGEIQVTMLDVGQGDGIFLRGPSADCYLIDGGSSDVSSVGTYQIEPYLLSKAVDRLEYVFVTHGDEDHISGVRELLEGQDLGVRIENLILPPLEYHDEKLRELAELAAGQGTRVAVMEAGDRITEAASPLIHWHGEKEPLHITCLGPETGLDLDPGNGASLVLEIKYDAFSMLLTGDVEQEGEEALLAGGRLGRYDILKAAHHGSRNSGSEAFLEQTAPKAALISAGEDNRYGHPHQETLERLEKIECLVYSTQECGAVTVASDGDKIRILTFSERAKSIAR